jgi:pimeloyl-ACP methyl ester carboxylesterase
MLLAAALPGPASAATRAASPPRLVTQEFMVPTADPGIRLYVRNKHPVGVSAYPADKILLFVHGATYPAETSFDLELNGLSWMDYIARRGYDVYLVDVRGYGRSSRPPEMDKPAGQNAPIVHTTTAVQDVGTAVDFILRRRHVAKLDLMGWSWGTIIMGWYTAQHDDQVVKLVLYAPVWLRQTQSLTDPGSRLGAYRTVSVAAARARWLHGVPQDQQATLIPPGWFDAWARATFPPATSAGAASAAAASSNTDPAPALGLLRAPNGVTADGRDYWNVGKPMYDPGDIRVPTFLAHAEWDADAPNDMLYAYFARLTHTPYKRFVQIGEGTHTVIMEKNRMQLFEAVQQFLDESSPVGH